MLHGYWLGSISLMTVFLLATGCSGSSDDDGPVIIFPDTSPDRDTSPDVDRDVEDEAAEEVGDDVTPDVPEPECDTANPCEAPMICVDLQCVFGCDESRLCADPLLCVDNVCVPECEQDADCDEGELCRGQQCVVPDCVSDADCDTATQTCESEVCTDLPCDVQAFTYDPQGATPTTVHVAGSFNDWAATNATGLAMTYSDELSLWTVRQSLENGSYQYKFVLDDTDWIQDPANPIGIDDGFGGQNSVLNVDCGGEPQTGLCGEVDVFDWRDAMMYFLLVDRFNDSDGSADPVTDATGGDASSGPSGQYEGGDLTGVQQKLGYLTDLGVTALWLSAPFENRNSAGAAIDPGADPHLYSGYHGYWPSPADIDYSDPDNPTPRPQVESRVGSEADLTSLIDAAHAAEGYDGHGLKVLFDYVMNHVDVESGLYNAHEFHDWFSGTRDDVPLCPEVGWNDPYWGTRCAFTYYLPAFDFDNADARRWSVDDAMWWAKTFDIDGYRLDAIKHVPIPWLEELRARVTSEIQDPEGGRFYLVGETFDYFDRDALARFIDPDTMLDGQFDFPMKANLCRALFSKEQGMDGFSSWIAGNDSYYGDGALMTTWIGNHDIPRSIHFASGQIGNCTEGSHTGNSWTGDFQQPTDAAPYERLGLAFAVMMTNPGIPLIYYGDEIGLAGGGDPDNRRMMPWNDGALNEHQLALRDRVTALARIRAENKVVTRGRREVLYTDADTWIYKMTGCADASSDVIIGINRADGDATLAMPAGTYTDLVTNTSVSGGATTVPARSFVVWRAE